MKHSQTTNHKFQKPQTIHEHHNKFTKHSRQPRTTHPQVINHSRTTNHKTSHHSRTTTAHAREDDTQNGPWNGNQNRKRKIRTSVFHVKPSERDLEQLFNIIISVGITIWSRVFPGTTVPLTIHATHCNTLQHTATRCNTLQYTATYCYILQHGNGLYHSPFTNRILTNENGWDYKLVRLGNTLQHTETCCNVIYYIATPHLVRCKDVCAGFRIEKWKCCNAQQHTATHSNVLGIQNLQDAATHCNTMQHNAAQCSTMQHTAA